MENLPEREIWLKYTETQIIDYLSNVIDLLENTKLPADSDFIEQLILRLSTVYRDHKPYLDKICELYIKRKVINLLYCFLINLKFVESNYSVEVICTLLINYSLHSQKIAQKLKTSKILDFIIDKYLEMQSNDPTVNKSSSLFELVLTIIHNYSSNPINKITYKTTEIKKSLVKMIKFDTDDFFGIISMLILSYLIDEHEVNLLSDGVNILGNLIKRIKAVSEEKQDINGFTLKELLHGLCCISANDSMKQRIVDENGLPILINILKTYNNDNQIIESTLGVIEHLSFNNDIKNSLIKSDIENIFKQFAETSCEKIKKIINGTIWNIEEKWEKFHKEISIGKRNNRKKFDVFISYCWANKEKVLEIYSKLKLMRISAWIDEEQMCGSSIEAMANGIEDSSVFVLAISSNYKSSCNCQHEAKFAFHIKKPIIPLRVETKYKPTSWLGFIIGDKIYYEFSGRRDPKIEFKKLHKSIENNLNSIDNQSSDNENKDKSKKKNTNKSFQDESEKYKQWTNKDVLKWLDDCQLGHLKSYFNKVDGSILHVMIDAKFNSADYFNNSLKTEFKMKLIDVMMFHKALNELK